MRLGQRSIEADAAVLTTLIRGSAQYHVDDEVHGPYWPAIYSDVTFTRGVVSLRFDDNDQVEYSTIYPLLRDRNLVALFAVPYDTIDAVSKCTLTQLKQMQRRGMEIACHSRTHGGSPATVADFISETTAAADDMRALGLHVQHFIQPGTWTGDCYFDSEAKMDGVFGRILRSYFATASSYVPVSGDTNNVCAMPRRKHFGGNGRSSNYLSVAVIEDQIDKVTMYGGGIEIYFHSYNFGTGGGNLTLAEFTTILDYIETARDGGYLDNLTPTGMNYAQQSATPHNILFDPQMLLQVTGTLYGWRPYSGTPTITAGAGRSGGNAATVGAGANSISQMLIGSNLRSLMVRVWVKSAATGVAGYARVYVQANDTSKLNDYVALTTTDAWQEMVICVGCPPDNTAGVDQVQVWFYATNVGGAVLFSDPVVRKL